MAFSVELVKKYFPQLAFWCTMPAFTGWIAFSSGIATVWLLPAGLLPKLYIIENIYTTTLLIIILIFAVICKNIFVRSFAFYLAGFLLFSVQLHDERNVYARLADTIASDSTCIVRGNLISTPLLTNATYSYYLAADTLTTATGTIPLYRKIIKCSAQRPPSSAGVLICRGTLRLPLSHAINPYGFDEYMYLRSNRLWATILVDSQKIIKPAQSLLHQASVSTREYVYKTIRYVQDPRIQGILQAVFLGEYNNMSESIKSSFRIAGIYHLLSISGLHIAILIATVLLILYYIPLPGTFKIIITITFIWCYLFFIGLIPPLFRSVIMATVLLCGTLTQKNYHNLNALGLAGILWLSMAPHCLFTPGYQLSFAATFGILTLYPILNEHFTPQCDNQIVQFFITKTVSSFYISCAGFLATLPILVYHFGQVSIYGLVANIFAVFLMSLGMNAFFLGLLLQAIAEPLVPIAMFFANLFLTLIAHIATLSTKFPWSSLQAPVPYPEFIVLYCLLCIGIITSIKTARKRFILWSLPVVLSVVPLSCVIHSGTARTGITFFAVKSGSMSGITFPDSKQWVLLNPDNNASFKHYSAIVEPWMRHTMMKEFDALVLLSTPLNTIQILAPIFRQCPPKCVITCSEAADDILREDLEAFLAEYSVKHIHVSDDMGFVPAPQCTVTIDENFSRQGRSPDKRSATISLHYRNRDSDERIGLIKDSLTTAQFLSL